MTLPNTASLFRTPLRVCLMLCVTMLSALPFPAHAGLLADRLELSMYGRMGLAWTPTSGRYIQGRSLNLMGGTIGGRLEEGDYLEPVLRVHILEKQETPEAPYVDMVLTPAIYSANGLFAGLFSTRFSDTLSIQLFQGYVEAGNVLLPGLRMWAGARFYRGADVHIADYFFFNNLSGQGGGIAYGPLDLAVILQTSLTSNQYNFDVDGNGTLDIRRQRTVFVAQYVQKFGDSGHSLHGLAELHLLPSARAQLADGSQVGLRSDFGWVAGVKAHLDLGNGSFNDVSVRYGSRIANGSRGGAQTWDTFGAPDLRGLYTNAAGVEAVEHFLYNFSPLFSLNVYGILHWAQGASDLETDKSLDFGVGARGVLYLHDKFHLIGEAHYQGFQPGNAPLATATKLTIMPTFAPIGGRSVWARPQFRIFYTAAFYDQDAVDALYSPYLQTVGATSVGHYLGTRVEWWF
ncbi:carbohydrate porin [Archangium sp.]|uniref:carbohydrate porin n=1 Tax=Archangium sp. TaxID=1872627 RepID=UPI002D731976|nr:carbohydrate porin [Archangium sp.]HYO56778.1 carbohydrate porin [Archangium sp.]